MRRKQRLTGFLSAILICSLIPLSTSVTALDLYDHDLDGETINQGSSLDIDLGIVNAGKMISISFLASENVDVVLLTESQYNSANSQNYIINGSEIDTSIVIYTWTVESTDNYWVVIDNSNAINGGANSGQEVTLSYGYVDISDSILGEYKSRLFVEPNSYFHYNFGPVSKGDVLHMSISCENWITHDLDIYLVKEENRESFLNGQDYWDRNATILEGCLEIWDFELIETGNWHVFVENGPRGDADTDNEGVLVDVFFFAYENLPTVIQSTTRMIENSDVWRVDLGTLSQNDILSFTLSINNEIFADIDVLIMESSEADKYVLGQQASVLGHASLINSGSLDTWDYTFPDSGTYSLIIDNSESPEGGASENKALQVEINVQEVTILGDWIGWYQSRHYVEDGSFVSFDLGSLEPGDEIYYTVSGTSFGSGFLSSFDMMVMTGSQYSIYSTGGNPEIIEEASDLDTWISIFQDYTIETTDNYWVVIDAADGPNGGADSNGAWSFDYTIKSSRNQITSPQVKDSNYQMIATHPADTNLIEQIEDNQNNDIDQNSNIDQNTDNSNQGNQQSQDSGQTNIGNAQSKSDDGFGGAGSACGGFLVVIVALVVIRRKRSSNAQLDQFQGHSPNQPMQPPQGYGLQPPTGYPPKPTQPAQGFGAQTQTGYPPKPTQPPQGYGAQTQTGYPPKPTQSPQGYAPEMTHVGYSKPKPSPPPNFQPTPNQYAETFSPGYHERMKTHNENTDRERWGRKYSEQEVWGRRQNDNATHVSSQNDALLRMELPPINQMGYLGADGYYWLEWPISSGKWFHRSETNQNWTPLKN
jgi:hypothetical protein